MNPLRSLAGAMIVSSAIAISPATLQAQTTNSTIPGALELKEAGQRLKAAECRIFHTECDPSKQPRHITDIVERVAYINRLLWVDDAPVSFPEDPKRVLAELERIKEVRKSVPLLLGALDPILLDRAIGLTWIVISEREKQKARTK